MFLKIKELSITNTGILLYLTLCVLIFSCKRANKHFNSPVNYNLNRPYIIKLPSELDDISGLCYYRKDNSLFLESDEKGCLYKMLLKKPTDIRKWKFSHKKDYEDIVLVDSTFYVLNSNGGIIALNFLNDSISMHEYTFPEKGSYEFESLYYDDKLKKLVMICKDCDLDKTGVTSTYTFDPQQLNYGSSFTMDTRKITDVTGPHAGKFKPSAAAINPITKDLYIVSSVNRALIIANRGGGIKEIYPLNPALYNQPEGITFSPSGDMFISNEAGKLDPANIYYFQYKKTTNE